MVTLLYKDDGRAKVMEANPNHPVTKEIHDHWHKIAALMMWKMGKTRYVITPEDVSRAFKADLNITVRFDDEIGVILTLVDSKEAERLVQKEGGLPV
jgi:hypothetical protein